MKRTLQTLRQKLRQKLEATGRAIGDLSIGWVIGLAGLVACLVIAISVYWARYPFQANRLKDNYDLRRAGVRSINVHGLHAFDHNLCESGRPCTCVGLIHGLADDAHTWKQILRLPKSAWSRPIRLVAFDLPGSGDSPAPPLPRDYSVRTQAETVRGAMAELCPHWILVGNSLGGWVAAWVALDWPEGVSGLVLADSAGLRENAAPLRAFFANPTVDSLQDFQRKAYYLPRELPPTIWKAAVESIRAGNAQAVAEAQGPQDFLDSRLASLRVPTLLIWGKSDQITPLAEGQRMRDKIPGAAWQEVPHCAHLPQKECPEAVVAGLNRFLGSH